MRVISPSVEIITESNPLKRIELCGRVCYKSEDKITDTSAEKFVERLIKSGHTSVLEHARLKFDYSLREAVINKITHLGYSWVWEVFNRTYDDGEAIRINARDFLALFPDTLAFELAKMENADDYMTVRFVCDRAIANELVRHRVFSFSQESTRYVNYKEGVTFVEPLPYGDTATWVGAMSAAEGAYIEMIENGATPQEARNVLPLSTKTELIMTGTFNQWREMLKLRTASGAHPQMRYLMHLLMTDEKFPETLKETENESNHTPAHH